MSRVWICICRESLTNLMVSIFVFCTSPLQVCVLAGFNGSNCSLVKPMHRSSVKHWTDEVLVEDAFWSCWVILRLLVILGSNLVVFAPKRKKVNFATRRRQIHPTSLKKYLFFGKFLVDIFIHEISRWFRFWPRQPAQFGWILVGFWDHQGTQDPFLAGWLAPSLWGLHCKNEWGAMGRWAHGPVGYGPQKLLKSADFQWGPKAVGVWFLSPHPSHTAARSGGRGANVPSLPLGNSPEIGRAVVANNYSTIIQQIFNNYSTIIQQSFNNPAPAQEIIQQLFNNDSTMIQQWFNNY